VFVFFLSPLFLFPFFFFFFYRKKKGGGGGGGGGGVMKIDSPGSSPRSPTGL